MVFEGYGAYNFTKCGTNENATTLDSLIIPSVIFIAQLLVNMALLDPTPPGLSG